MDREQREDLARRVLAFSQADQTEVLLVDRDASLSRFTHDAIHQNVASADLSIAVRAIAEGRTGVARTNVLDEASLRDVVARALAIARHAPADPEQPALPAGAPPPAPAEAFAEATARATPQLRAQICEGIFRAGEADGLWAAGYAATERGGITVANSNGARASFDGSDAAANVKMNGSDSSGFAEAYDTDVRRLDGTLLGAIAARKARESAHPRDVEPGPWTVILEPAAFGELFSYIADHFSALSFDEGSSFLSDGLDRTYLGENVTISDDYAQPLAPGMPFDFEGFPTKRLALVEHGVARAIVTDSYWAHKLGRENTGHALPAPNASGPQARNLVVSAGSKNAAQLVAETKRGLLVTRFWYIRTVDQKKAIVTGMTRDGTFLIEDGKVTGGVRNMRFNQSILEALRHCEFASELSRTGGYSYSIVVPAVKIENFTFSSGTGF